MRYDPRFLRRLLIGLLFMHSGSTLLSQEVTSSIAIARVKYGGGGDWYNDPSAIPNLARFIRERTGVDMAGEEHRVALSDETLFNYPILFLTGHGRITLSDADAVRLKTYLMRGGFLIADDDYGLDASFREAMTKVFPGRSLVELPFSHEIYHIHFSFPGGLPKIHEHDGKPPQGLGMFDDDGRLMLFYVYESNLSDGWTDARVHGDPPERRNAALRMGANIVLYALTH